MSLDVELVGEPREVSCTCPTCDHPHTRIVAEEYFTANITHNLGRMASEAGIYQHLWRPEELGITKAGDLIEPLRAGLATMRADPERFEALNPSNGWGSFDAFVPWIERYLEACEEYPTANVKADR